MQRYLIGIFAISFLGAAAALFVFGGDDVEFWLSVCMRVGFVLAAMWLAYHQVLKITERVPPWVFALFLICLVVGARYPRFLLLMFPVLAGIAVLQFFGWLFKPLPNPKKQPRPSATAKPEE